MLEDIISFLPSSRQILLYSATFPISVKEFKVGGSIYLEVFTTFLLFSLPALYFKFCV